MSFFYSKVNKKNNLNSLLFLAEREKKKKPAQVMATPMDNAMSHL